MAEQRELPGWPKKKLVGEVRWYLRNYGIQPKSREIWLATWEWASRIADSYYRKVWPSPREIASQYVFLLLARMKGDFLLKLPHRAGDHLPDAARAILLEAADRKRVGSSANGAESPPVFGFLDGSTATEAEVARAAE
jgi:hypothetical protein